MFFVPLYVEAIRSRPAVVFWLATLAQALIWLLVPFLFYAAPPGDLAQLLAIGHELRFDSAVGPPLAYWLAEIAFRLAGMFGVYALAQLCVIVTYWSVFALARSIVGAAHAAMAVLLMIGVSLFTVPSPDFGPPILAMALWAFALLHYWRAVALGRSRAWYLFGAATALLLLTTDAALIFIGPLVLFTALTERGRAALHTFEPWIVGIVLSGFLFVHLLWLQNVADAPAQLVSRLRDAAVAGTNTSAWLRLLFVLVVAHAGLAILLVLASGWPRAPADLLPPPLARAKLPAFAVSFVKVFALLPALLATIFAVVAGHRLPVGGAAPLVVLSSLAVIVAAGERIELHHQRILGFAWVGLLLVPAIFVPMLILTLPWTLGSDLRVALPAAEMGRFFADNFERRTGQKLAVVTGDPDTAALVALGAPSRPSVFFDADPARSPWVSVDDIRTKGAIVVWPAADTSAAPPPDIKAYFPDLVPELPRAFDRPVQGRLPLLRVGWGVIRPGSVAAATR